MAFDSDANEGAGFTAPNVVPLVDVMLVLLIIFMVASTVSHGVRVELPNATVEVRRPLADAPPVAITLRENGELFWNNELLADKSQLEARLAVEAQRLPQPDIMLRADKDIRYAQIREITTRVRQAGMRSINFVSEPEF
ncbi:biopolymer transporter ExbD [Silanimonas sp.]|uniref:ExbD/TolR family protein n=1 Tax=Silanimonas sp. TaxID=1929290 RepID=UPI001BBCD3DD|nr:biopolymer transporter ExbD [Silanimonas sp.]MBS3896744.1 biopolymer transporter ExbD [Silanimonas sp.]MBS3924636.1 biopolymer transporter ExbD [Xanthomonadaceae bacterium]MBS3924984.1 biopolymer transporter ExbD [Xanthomonadaceae bacterium]